MKTEGNEINEDIKRGLETIIGILLDQSKFQQRTLGEKILFLDSLGHENKEIARMLNTTYSTVAKEKSKGKKAKKDE